jgi:hypothetical protein
VDLLGEVLGVNVRLFPLEIPHSGTTVDQRVALARIAEHRLADAGLIVDNTLTPALSCAIETLGRPEIVVTLLGRAGQLRLRAVACAAGQDAVAVAQHGDRVEFQFVDPATMAATVLRRLPYLVPGPGLPITITVPPGAETPTSGDSDESDNPFWGTTAMSLTAARPVELRDGGLGPVEAATGILRAPRRGTGSLTVSRRVRHRAGLSYIGSVTWVDNDQGRYAVITDTDHTGTRHITYTPGHYDRFLHAVNALIDGR